MTEHILTPEHQRAQRAAPSGRLGVTIPERLRLPDAYEVEAWYDPDTGRMGYATRIPDGAPDIDPPGWEAWHAAMKAWCEELRPTLRALHGPH